VTAVDSVGVSAQQAGCFGFALDEVSDVRFEGEALIVDDTEVFGCCHWPESVARSKWDDWKGKVALPGDGEDLALVAGERLAMCDCPGEHRG